MRVAHMLVPVLALLLTAPAVAQDAAAETLRYEFDPPLGIEIVQAVEIRTAIVALGTERIERWTHEVVITLDERTKDGDFSGTFQLRNVVDVENAEADVFYLMAKAIEGQSYPLVMYEFGMAAEVDWAAIKARIGETLPDLTTAENVAAVEAALPLFADPTKAVLRAIDAVGLTYVIPFRSDGELNTVDDLGGITYYGVEPAVIEVGGGRDPEVDAYIIDWLVTADSEVATKALADELRRLARTVDGTLGTDSSDTIEAAIAAGIQVAEDGYSIYDLEAGLLSQSTVTAIIYTEPVSYATRVTVERLSP